MPLQYDWGVDEKGDLDIQDNDFTYVLSDEQHIQDTIQSYPLWWKQFPADGVGVRSYEGSTGKVQQLMGEIKKQLQADGYSCNNPVVVIPPNGKVQINPNALRL